MTNEIYTKSEKLSSPIRSDITMGFSEPVTRQTDRVVAVLRDIGGLDDDIQVVHKTIQHNKKVECFICVRVGTEMACKQISCPKPKPKAPETPETV